MIGTHKLIAHGLLKIDDQYLVIKRTRIKRGKINVFPEYWDIPGGTVEVGELPQDAVKREVKEEVNLDVRIENIIHEDSTLDEEKDMVFTRLVYKTIIQTGKEPFCIVLDPEEHSEFKLIHTLEEIEGEKIVPYLIDVFLALNGK